MMLLKIVFFLFKRSKKFDTLIVFPENVEIKIKLESTSEVLFWFFLLLGLNPLSAQLISAPTSLGRIFIEKQKSSKK